MKFSIVPKRSTRFTRYNFCACILLIAFLTGFAAAGPVFDDVQQVEPQDSKKLVKQAKKLYRKGNAAGAEKILRRVLAREPRNSRAKLELAYLLLKRKRLVDAYNHAYDVALVEKKNSFAFAILGTTYLAAGNFVEARVLLNNALALRKKEALAWAGLGMLDFYENRIKTATLYLKRAVYYNSREPDFEFALAQVSARAENYKDAAKAYDRYLRIAHERDKERKDRIRGLIRFLSFLGQRPSLYDLGGAKSTSLPMTLVNNRPVIQLRLKKRGTPLNFVLDTGSGISVISRDTARRLKIRAVTRGGLARALGGSGKFPIVYGFLKKVRIGDVSIRNVPVYIREFHNRSERIDGYIGLSLISKYITTIDYGKKRFGLIRKGQSVNLPFSEHSMTVPLRLTSSGFLSGQVKLHGIEPPLNFIVDTGASVSVISEDLAGSTELSSYVQEETLRVIGAAGITEGVPSLLLPNVTFGRFSHQNLKAIALDLDLINEASGFEQAGILGGNFLRDYRLTFDFKQSKVTFTPNEKD